MSRQKRVRSSSSTTAFPLPLPWLAVVMDIEWESQVWWFLRLSHVFPHNIQSTMIWRQPLHSASAKSQFVSTFPLSFFSFLDPNHIYSTSLFFEALSPGALLPLPLEDSPIRALDEFVKSWIHVRPEVIKLLRKRSIWLSYHISSLSKFTYDATSWNQDNSNCCHRRYASRSAGGFSWNIVMRSWWMRSEPKIPKLKSYIDPRVLDGKVILPVTIGYPTFRKWPFLRRRIHKELRSTKWEALRGLKRRYMIEGKILWWGGWLV